MASAFPVVQLFRVFLVFLCCCLSYVEPTICDHNYLFTCPISCCGLGSSRECCHFVQSTGGKLVLGIGGTLILLMIAFIYYYCACRKKNREFNKAKKAREERFLQEGGERVKTSTQTSSHPPEHKKWWQKSPFKKSEGPPVPPTMPSYDQAPPPQPYGMQRTPGYPDGCPPPVWTPPSYQLGERDLYPPEPPGPAGPYAPPMGNHLPYPTQ